jgi:dihydroorotate dehydrogenase
MKNYWRNILNNRIIIAAPFGNYLHFSGCNRTLGTFTLEPRPGRFWKVASTLRYNWRQKSWINKIGLRNPGIDSLDVNQIRDNIISVHGFNLVEWRALIEHLIYAHSREYLDRSPTYMELNLSCPNVKDNFHIEDLYHIIDRALKRGYKIIAKLPPIKWMEMGKPLYDMGIRFFHLCNTIPSPGGGISGKPLKQFSLWAIQDFRQAFGDSVSLIGGGGISSIADLEDYRAAGANYYSIGSMLLNPFNWRKVPSFVKWSQS